MQFKAGATPWLRGLRGAVSLKPRIPGHLPEARTLDALPGGRYPSYPRHDISSLRRFSQAPRSHKAQVKANQVVEEGPDAVWQGQALSTPCVAGFYGGALPVSCGLPKNPLLLSLPNPAHDSKRYFSHTWLKECYLSLEKSLPTCDKWGSHSRCPYRKIS